MTHGLALQLAATFVCTKLLCEHVELDQLTLLSKPHHLQPSRIELAASVHHHRCSAHNFLLDDGEKEVVQLSRSFVQEERCHRLENNSQVQHFRLQPCITIAALP